MNNKVKFLRGTAAEYANAVKDDDTFYYTVHDLHPHEAKKVFYKQFRHKMMYRKLAQIRSGVNNLITNSKSQEVELKEMFPEKKVYYHEFPSLINQLHL